MLKIKVKYRDEKELAKLLEVLKPYLIRWKAPELTGETRHAYIDINM